MDPSQSQQCSTTSAPTTAPAASSGSNGSGTNLTATTTGAVGGVSSTSSPSVVTIPVAIQSSEDIFTYVIVKGSLHDQNASIFGLNREEISALSRRFASGSTEIVNGIMIRGSPVDAINTLSKLGYKVVCSTGEAECVWTMQREI